MRHIARFPTFLSDHGAARRPVRASASHETIFMVLAALARKFSDGELAAISAAAGVVALSAAARGRATWMLLAGCYLIWCFATWGILFGKTPPSSRLLRALEMLIAGSATAIFAIMGSAVFFWLLGSHWQL